LRADLKKGHDNDQSLLHVSKLINVMMNDSN